LTIVKDSPTTALSTADKGRGRVLNWDELGGESPTMYRFRGLDHGATFCVLVSDMAPGAGPRLHRHPYEEVFVVHEGRARFAAGEDAIEAVAGQVVVVPAGTPHRFVNVGDGPLRVTSVHPHPSGDVEWLED
jgi:quercetin dioxygenase-like cupin family protein